MADEPLSDDANDELLLTDEVEQDAPEAEDNPDNQDDGDDEELTVSFGDGTEDEPDDSNLVRHLREELKKKNQALADARKSAPQPAPIEVGEKPTLVNCEYDEDEYERQLDAWKERKAAAEREEAEAGKVTESEQQAWAGDHQRYVDGKAALGVKDMDEAQDTVTAVLSSVQQAVIVKVANDPAKVVYALGKHPDRLAQIAAIQDPLKLAAEIARVEGTLKMVKRRRAPDPERIERGSAQVSPIGADKTLEKLEKEAERTGNRSKVIAYKRAQKAKARGE